MAGVMRGYPARLGRRGASQMVDRFQNEGIGPSILPGTPSGEGQMIALGAPSRGLMMGGRLPVAGAVQGQHMAPQAAQVRPRLGANDIPAGSKDWMPLAPPGPGEPPRIPFFRTWGGNLTQGEIDNFWGNPRAPFPPGYGPQAPLYPQAAPPAAPPAVQGVPVAPQRPYSPAPQIGPAPGGGGGYAAAGVGSSLVPQGGPLSSGASSVGMAGTPEGRAFDRIRSFRERWGQTYTPQPRQVPTYDQALAEAQGIRTPLEEANAALNARNQYSSDQNFAQGMRPIYGGRTSNEIAGEANRMASPAIGYPDRNNMQPVDGRYAVNPQGRYAMGGQYALPGEMSTIDRTATRQSLAPTSAQERAFPAPRPGFYGSIGPDGKVQGSPNSMPYAPSVTREQQATFAQRRAERRARESGVSVAPGSTTADINAAINESLTQRRANALGSRGGRRSGGAFGQVNADRIAASGPSPLITADPETGTVARNTNWTDASHPLSQEVARAMDNPRLAGNPDAMRRYLMSKKYTGQDIDDFIAAMEEDANGYLWTGIGSKAGGRWKKWRNSFVRQQGTPAAPAPAAPAAPLSPAFTGVMSPGF